jgi:hypothetical protein
MLGTLALVLAGCGGGVSVTSDWDPGFNFSSLQTFAVLDAAQGGGGLDQINQNRIKTSIINTLAAKGMRQEITTDERSSFNTVSTGWGGYGYGRGGWYGGSSMGMTTSRTTETRYEVGSLAIAIFDSEKQEMVFTATGSKTLASGNPSPEQVQKNIDEAVTKILEDWPPGSGD